MKPMLGIVLAMGLVLFLIWQFGMSGFSPEEQAGQLQAKIKSGMTWQQVVDIHKPGKFRAFGLDSSGLTVQGSAEKFKLEDVASAIKAGSFPVGFAFEYFLSNEHHYRIEFDGQGKVVGRVERLATINDLLNP